MQEQQIIKTVNEFNKTAIHQQDLIQYEGGMQMYLCGVSWISTTFIKNISKGKTMQERFFKQAWETLKDNIKIVRGGYTINAFNKTVDNSGISPTLTTRPEGFKTAILIIEEKE